ncbi:kinase-like domain-containing protein [Schizophyllum fasciatum]
MRSSPQRIFPAANSLRRLRQCTALLRARHLATEAALQPRNVFPALPPPPPTWSLPEQIDDTVFGYTSGRWLYNEHHQLKQRYTPFNVPALRARIAQVCGSEVAEWNKKEGVFNKSFVVTLRDGRQVAVRVKNPIAGPVHYTTASEVAIKDFCRTVLKLPVPRVLDWSSHADYNGIGCEYIIMDHARGVQLSTIWHTLDASKRKDIINSLIATEKRLLNASFSHYGSLYYKQDVHPALRAPTLFADGRRETSETSKFCIGPVCSRMYWEEERASMKLDRGPWSTCDAYLDSIAAREQAWISAYAKPHIHDDPFRAITGPQLPEEHIAVLDQFRAVARHIVPRTPDGKPLRSVLWHPDLNLGNIFVDPSGAHPITSIIDWQGCWAGPAYLQMTVPSFLQCRNVTVPSGLEMPRLPADLHELAPDVQRVLVKNHKAVVLQKLYEIRQLLPYHGARRELRAMPVAMAGRTWKDGILPLRLALLNVAAHWPKLADAADPAPCPLRFTRGEVQGLMRQRERYVRWHDFLEYLHESFGVQPYGWVDAASYELTKRKLERIRQRLDTQLVMEMERAAPGGSWWPFRDTLQ